MPKPLQQSRVFSLALALMCLNVHAGQTIQSLAGRTAIVYTPDHLPPSGTRALVVVLHGGMGNATRIAHQQAEGSINLDAMADAGGFVVAYLNGTPVSPLLRKDMLGWNAGACCGQPALDHVDDVAYIENAAQRIAAQYGVDPKKIYGVGHSNGAMMMQRMACETALFAAVVPISGPLETGASRCAGANGKPLLAIHGANDQNVPITGGLGKGLAHVSFTSEDATAKVWRDSGAHYELQVIPGAEHSTQSLNARIIQTEGQTLAQKVVQFLGLDKGH